MVARALYSAQPADKRPASIAEFVKASGHRALAPYMAGAANATPPAERVVTPPPSGGGSMAPATGKPDATALREARIAAMGKPPTSPEVQRLQALLSR